MRWGIMDRNMGCAAERYVIQDAPIAKARGTPMAANAIRPIKRNTIAIKQCSPPFAYLSDTRSFFTSKAERGARTASTAFTMMHTAQMMPHTGMIPYM